MKITTALSRKLNSTEKGKEEEDYDNDKVAKSSD